MCPQHHFQDAPRRQIKTDDVFPLHALHHHYFFGPGKSSTVLNFPPSSLIQMNDLTITHILDWRMKLFTLNYNSTTRFSTTNTVICRHIHEIKQIEIATYINQINEHKRGRNR